VARLRLLIAHDLSEDQCSLFRTVLWRRICYAAAAKQNRADAIGGPFARRLLDFQHQGMVADG
jgi:hypothetical protein